MGNTHTGSFIPKTGHWKLKAPAYFAGAFQDNLLDKLLQFVRQLVQLLRCTVQIKHLLPRSVCSLLGFLLAGFADLLADSLHLLCQGLAFVRGNLPPDTGKPGIGSLVLLLRRLKTLRRCRILFCEHRFRIPPDDRRRSLARLHPLNGRS